jgi:hypothetical protein
MSDLDCTSAISWSDVEDLVINYFRCNCLRPTDYFDGIKVTSNTGRHDSVVPTETSSSNSNSSPPLAAGREWTKEVAGDWEVLSGLATEDILALYPSGPKRGKVEWLSHVTKTYNRYLSPFLQFSVVDPTNFINKMRTLSKEQQNGLFSKVSGDHDEWSLTVPWTLDVRVKTGCAIALCCFSLNRTFHSTGSNLFHFRKLKDAGANKRKFLISFVHTVTE